MAIHKPPQTAVMVLRDIRRDWRGWSKAERFTAALIGSALAYLALVIAVAPRLAG